MLCTLTSVVLAFVTPAAAQAAVSVGDVSVSEGNGGVSATFTVTRSTGLLTGATSVSFRTVAGSATALADYAPTSGTLRFGSSLFGETQVQQVSVPIVGDRLDEPDESFRLVLAGAEVADGEGVATIIDDDPPPVIGVADTAPATEGAAASFTVGLSSASGRDVSVAFATADGSAIAGQDYTARSGSLTIPAGATSAAIAVPLTDDSADEPTESFELRLSAPGAATLGDAVATATILDNDEPPTPAATSSPPPATLPPPAAPLPTLPVTGSATPPAGLTRLGVGSPRLRQPGTALVTISCPQAAGSCSGQITLFSRPNSRSKIRQLRKERRLSRRPFTLSGGRTQTLTFVLRRADRRLLERAGRIEVRAYAITKDVGGRSDVRTANGTLVRRTSHSSA